MTKLPKWFYLLAAFAVGVAAWPIAERPIKGAYRVAVPVKPNVERGEVYADARRAIHLLGFEQANEVMFGDSNIELGPWPELLRCPSVANRGIGGDTSGGARRRLPEVLALKPKQFFGMIGVNDIVKRVPTEQTHRNIEAIFDQLSKSGAEITWTYVMRVGPRYPDAVRVNAEVDALNRFIRETLRGYPQIVGIDMNPRFATIDGLFYDEIHLRAVGLRAWREAILDRFRCS